MILAWNIRTTEWPSRQWWFKLRSALITDNIVKFYKSYTSMHYNKSSYHKVFIILHKYEMLFFILLIQLLSLSLRTNKGGLVQLICLTRHLMHWSFFAVTSKEYQNPFQELSSRGEDVHANFASQHWSVQLMTLQFITSFFGVSWSLYNTLLFSLSVQPSQPNADYKNVL